MLRGPRTESTSENMHTYIIDDVTDCEDVTSMHLTNDRRMLAANITSIFRSPSARPTDREDSR